jgi:AbrB family looped-hinge helix DNA binding protein
MKTTISEKGQITIPKAVRERLGLRAGQVLDVKAEGGSIVLTKRMSEDVFASVVGIIKLSGSTDEAIEELRGRAEEP